MGKLKNQTFLEKCGFKDGDLSTTKHDEMMLYYMDRVNMLSMLKSNEIITPNVKVSNIKIETEHPITSSNNYIIGFVDICLLISTRVYGADGWNRFLFIEIKTKITNFGETMRQINTYRQFHPKKKFMLITNGKCPFKEAFESQKVLVVEHDKNKEGFFEPNENQDR